jgi:hypothetical protein
MTAFPVPKNKTVLAAWQAHFKKHKKLPEMKKDSPDVAYAEIAGLWRREGNTYSEDLIPDVPTGAEAAAFLAKMELFLPSLKEMEAEKAKTKAAAAAVQAEAAGASATTATTATTTATTATSALATAMDTSK